MKGYRISPIDPDDNTVIDTCQVFYPKINNSISQVKLEWSSYPHEFTLKKDFTELVRNDFLWVCGSKTNNPNDDVEDNQSNLMKQDKVQNIDTEQDKDNIIFDLTSDVQGTNHTNCTDVLQFESNANGSELYERTQSNIDEEKMILEQLKLLYDDTSGNDTFTYNVCGKLVHISTFHFPTTGKNIPDRTVKKMMEFVDFSTITDPTQITYKYQTLVAIASTWLEKKGTTRFARGTVLISMCIGSSTTPDRSICSSSNTSFSLY